MSLPTERLLNIAAAIVTVCAVTMTGIRIWQAVEPPGGTGTSPPQHIANWQRYGSTNLRLGPPAPAVTIVEFSDFQCPFCRRAAPALRALREKYPRDLAVVYRHLPGHDFSLAAAIAAQCSASWGAFEKYHDLLFAQADSIGKKSWAQFALEAGLADTLGFNLCTRSTAPAQAVQRDKEDAATLGVDVTPSFLVNGLLFSGYSDPARLNETVAAVFKQLGK